LTNLNAPLDPANYPDHFPANTLSLRTQHSLELVHNDHKFSLDDVCELKHSLRMLLADRVKDDLIKAVRAQHSQGEIADAAELLVGWDNTVSADSQGSTLFARWWTIYSKDEKGGFEVPWSAAEPTSTPRGLDKRQWAVECFVQAVEDTKTQYGRWDVAWGDVHRIRKGDVDLPTSGGPGGMGCFRVADFRTDPADGKQVVNTGDSWVFAVEFAAQPKAYTIVGYSQSGVAGSAHYSDQAALYSANQLKPAAFTEAEIKAQLEKAYRPGEE
jgi:acyl-homoserine-lactone acylase